MCGIVCVFDYKQERLQMRQQILDMVSCVRHRGPDWSGIYDHQHIVFAHERLAIVDPTSGKQPLYGREKRYVLAANGEIYNHLHLKQKYCQNYPFQTASDCEVIIALYEQFGSSFIDKLNGIFSFALYDTEQKKMLVARDHVGVVPLYYGWDYRGSFYIASELKALEGYCNQIKNFPPGTYMDNLDGKTTQWYHPKWVNYKKVQNNQTSIKKIHDGLSDAVHRQLMSDVPYGVLLSGGLDSSIISALAKKFSTKRIESGDTKQAWWPQLHSFSVGLKGSPDLDAAQKVANHIGTVHHPIEFTIQEGLDAIRQVIYHLETYDITTVRASTPMFLMARAIKALGIKMVLSGEGADEVFGGYLYFHLAPDAHEFHQETIRKIQKLHLYDCLRANKSLAAWGIEGRVPFLDKQFMEIAMNLDPRDKMITDQRMEKWVLRKAFESYLPDDVVWRQKEQFSDGVGYNWIDTLKELVESSISNEMMQHAHYRFPVQTPRNKEEYYYRNIFESHFPSVQAALTVPSIPSVACSTETALKWSDQLQNQNEPSGRAIEKIHVDGYKFQKPIEVSDA
ncbi:MAG: asparagine synthase B [Flavobacteriaceae bacterium]|nr:asparagine synthase B [Flavobacteriaceae bacterium]MCY4267124.1 asparagine synthase B [Flavobacteriaceae bacterium]